MEGDFATAIVPLSGTPAVESDVSAPIYRAPMRTDIMRSLDANIEIIGVFWCGDTKMAADAAGLRNMHSTDCH
jgi:hypothetical protein